MSDNLNNPITSRGTRRKREVTPEQHERLKTVGFQKGQSGNPAGRPPEDAAIKEALRGRSIEAVDHAYWLMKNSANEMVQAKMVQFFTEPFVAKAATRHEIEVNKNESFTLLIDMMHQADAASIIEADAEDIDALSVSNVHKPCE